MSHEVSQFNSEQNSIALNNASITGGGKMSEITNIYCQKEIDGDYTVRRKDGTILIEDLEEDEAREIACRWNSHDALLKALKLALASLKCIPDNIEILATDGVPICEKIQKLKAAISQTEKEG